MEKKPAATERYYVLITYKPHDERLELHNNHLNDADYHYCTDETRRTGKVRVLRYAKRKDGSVCMEEVDTVDGTFTSVLCKYKEFEAWCCVGELTKRQKKGVEEELQRKRDSLTEPKCENLTCNRHISLLPESAATLRRWDDLKETKLQDSENAEVASDQLIRFIGDQELGFEQCLALERCINLVNDYRSDVARGAKPKPFKNVAEQKIKVDLHSWESAATIEELSRAAAIEPSEEFDTGGWIAEYLAKMGFGHRIQPYEEVKKKMFPSELPTKSATGRKSNKVPQNREELEGRRLAAVKYVQKHPEASLASVERKFNLGSRTLSRNPYKKMIGQFAENKGSGSKSKGRKDRSLGKNEKPDKSVKHIPDHRKSHVDEVDARLDGETET